LIVARSEEGQSLARALGPHWVVLMRRHGATVVGISMEEMVFRSVFSCRNAELQREAHALGGVTELTPAEIEKAGAFNLEPRPIERAWEYWTVRLGRTGGLPPRAGTRAKPKSKVRPGARPRAASVVGAASRKTSPSGTTNRKKGRTR